MRGLLFTAATVAALAALATQESAPPDLPRDMMATDSTSRLYVLQARGGTCAVRQGRADASGAALVKLEDSCADVLPALAGATRWRDQSDGSVAFANASGDKLIEFGPADGAGFETFGPNVPLASIREAE